MTIAKKLKDYLDREGVSYELHQHPTAYTAAETAGSQHVAGKKFVKAVIIKADNNFQMCVLPAIHVLDFDKLKDAIGAQEVALASESEVGNLFPDYELGAEPPLGELDGLKVWADSYLEENSEEVYFNGGTHTDTVKIGFKDYKKLANPTFVDFGTHI